MFKIITILIFAFLIIGCSELDVKNIKCDTKSDCPSDAICINRECVIAIDKCEPNPCQNKGICTNVKDGYTCKCLDDYEGDDCEIGIAFITTWKTDNLGISDDNQVKITTKGGGYDYSIDCDNDGSFEAEHQSGNYTCTYSKAGTYVIRIIGDFPRIYFEPDDNNTDSEKLLTIEQWGKQKWISMNCAFAGCKNLEFNANDTPNLSLVKDMTGMFYEASKFNQDISSWNVSSVNNMTSLFENASSFNQDIGSWNVSNVNDMNSMFRNASSFNQDISSWKVYNVNNMNAMFRDASSFNQNIGNWDVSNVNNMNNMFEYASSFNQDIGKWKVNNVAYMKQLFAGATKFNQNLSSWDVTNVSLCEEFSDGADAWTLPKPNFTQCDPE